LAARRYAERHGDAGRRTGLRGSGAALGEALFERILSGRSGALLSTHRHEDTWSFVRHDDGRIHLAIPELLAQVRDLGSEPDAPDGDLPMVLVAGERRSYNANTIFRDPAWRKQDPDGALRVHPADAARLGLSSGAAARVTSRRGVVEVRVKVCDTVREGMVTLPHGYGTDYPGDGGERRRAGPAVNDLTEAGHRDPIAATPLHKFVRVRVEPAAAPE
jgi:anaerobic selenocysteine-containing dehydrogenase